jgi:hypothetical protein
LVVIPPGFSHQHDGCQAQGKGVAVTNAADRLSFYRELTATDARTGAKRVCRWLFTDFSLTRVSGRL